MWTMELPLLWREQGNIDLEGVGAPSILTGNWQAVKQRPPAC